MFVILSLQVRNVLSTRGMLKQKLPSFNPVLEKAKPQINVSESPEKTRHLPNLASRRAIGQQWQRRRYLIEQVLKSCFSPNNSLAASVKANSSLSADDKATIGWSLE